jgi:4-alpha-glucanotransferase
MKYERRSGVLLHPSSLPGEYGIGDLGPAAYAFVDFLTRAGCSLWQVLPLGPTGYGDSPYQSFSAFAGNSYLISPQVLLQEDLLHPNDLVEAAGLPADRVDFARLIPWKLNLLERAYLRFTTHAPADLRQACDEFCHSQAFWLDDFSLFMAIKEAHGGGAWHSWPRELRQRQPAALAGARRSLAEAISRFGFYQFLFFRQWAALRTYAGEAGLHIIGDIPIFVAGDSADLWANPDLFFLDEAGRPSVVAGVPPDYFSPTGQLWGNPLYRWERHRESGYVWWVARLRHTLGLADILRLDHFRGFAGYWEIPAGSPTAEKGRWVPGPGADFFQALSRELGGLPFIAEDLGEITPDVVALRRQFSLPGMKILQFAFSGPGNPFLPHHYTRDCAVYTGTHDNDTARGWQQSAPPAELEFAYRYMNSGGGDFAWDLLRLGWSSTAALALAPMQDLLDLGPEARLNFPGRPEGNWSWRMDPGSLTDGLAGRLRDLNQLYGRLPGYAEDHKYAD